MKIEVDKQGIEIEMFVTEHNTTTLNSRIMDTARTEFSMNVFEDIYYDDGKPEFPSKPYSSLGYLYRHIRNIIRECIEISRNKQWDLITIGTYPFGSDRVFASGHIHTSIKKENGANLNETELSEIRKRLYNAQPLIACLSQNAPIHKATPYCKDTRLAFSRWARFTEYDDRENSHYLALALNRPRDIATIEVRIPSSSFPQQLIAVANVIRVILNNEENPVQIDFTKELWNRVINYGAQAIYPIKVPYKIDYCGIKYKKVQIPLYLLMKMFLEEYKEQIKQGLSGLPARIKQQIFEFYNTIAEGYTVSDYVLEYWKTLTNKEYIHQYYRELTESGYIREEPIWITQDKPKNILAPKIETKLTFEELIEISRQLEENSCKINEDIADLGEFLVSRSSSTKRIIANILAYINNSESVDYEHILRYISRGLLEDLAMHQIIRIDYTHNKVLKDKYFYTAIQMLEDYYW